SGGRKRRPGSPIPSQHRSAAPMAVSLGGGVERRRRLERRGLARVERANGLERIAEQGVDDGESIVRNRETGNAGARPHFLKGELGRGGAHRGTSVRLRVAEMLPILSHGCKC